MHGSRWVFSIFCCSFRYASVANQLKQSLSHITWLSWGIQKVLPSQMWFIIHLVSHSSLTPVPFHFARSLEMLNRHLSTFKMGHLWFRQSSFQMSSMTEIWAFACTVANLVCTWGIINSLKRKTGWTFQVQWRLFGLCQPVNGLNHAKWTSLPLPTFTKPSGRQGDRLQDLRKSPVCQCLGFIYIRDVKNAARGPDQACKRA